MPNKYNILSLVEFKWESNTIRFCCSTLFSVSMARYPFSLSLFISLALYLSPFFHVSLGGTLFSALQPTSLCSIFRFYIDCSLLIFDYCILIHANLRIMCTHGTHFRRSSFARARIYKIIYR